MFAYMCVCVYMCLRISQHDGEGDMAGENLCVYVCVCVCVCKSVAVSAYAVCYAIFTHTHGSVEYETCILACTNTHIQA